VVIAHDATVDEVISALEGIGSIGTGNVEVLLGANQQRITLSGGVTGDTFRLTFDGIETAAIAFDAPATGVGSILEALENHPSINPGDVEVSKPVDGEWLVRFNNTLATDKRLNLGTADVMLTGNMDSISVEFNIPITWTVEFVAARGGVDQPTMTVPNSTLAVQGGPVTVGETTTGSNGTTRVLRRTVIREPVNGIELLKIEGGGGDDLLILEGSLNTDTIGGFSAGVFFDGGDGMDIVQLQSKDATPNFVLPVFPDDTQGTITFDLGDVQFTDVEGGITLDAGGPAGTATLTGTDEGNEMRFAGRAVAGSATFARDGQVTTTLVNFGAGSTIHLNGAQGDDEISVALNGRTAFSTINIDTDGPAGTGTVRVEGSNAPDVFDYTPDASDPMAGSIIVDDGMTPVTVNFNNAAAVEIVGLGGDDQLTANAPGATTNDTILFLPQAGNDGSFQHIAQSGGPATAISYSPVSFSSIETRVFDTRGGTDTFAASSDDLPGVNSSASVVGGTATAGEVDTTISFGDQSTTFRHNITSADTVSMEIGTVVDDVTVTPGEGTAIAINTGVGLDLLSVNALGEDVSLDLAGGSISFPGSTPALGDVTYTSVENLRLVGDQLGLTAMPPFNNLTVNGTGGDDAFFYTPQTATGGQLELEGRRPLIGFDRFGGDFTIRGGPGVEEVLVLGSRGSDTIRVDSPGRNVGVRNSSLIELKSVNLGIDIDILSIDGRRGSDLILVGAANTNGVIDPNPLQINIDGGDPSASDALLIGGPAPTFNGVTQLAQNQFVVINRSLTENEGVVRVYEDLNFPSFDAPFVYPDIVYTNTEAVQANIFIDALGDPHQLNFGADEFEPNEFRANAALLGSAETINLANGSITSHFGLLADQDWYRVVAQHTGTLDVRVLFREYPGLIPGQGDLQLEVTDALGNVITGFGDNENDPLAGDRDERVRIPVVAGQTYYVHVFGATAEAINNFDLSIINEPPPVPFDIELKDLPVGDDTLNDIPLNSDTGRSQDDNITRDSTPTIFLRLDDAILLNDQPGNSTPNSPIDGAISIVHNADTDPADAASDPGFRVAIFVENNTHSEVLAGFAQPATDSLFVGSGVYEFTFTGALTDGSWTITSRVQMIDPAASAQSGFGPRGDSLEIIVDTVAEPVFFGLDSVIQATVIDQVNEHHSPTSFSGTDVSLTKDLAQTITVGIDGTLSSIEVAVFKSNPPLTSHLTLEIRPVEPNGEPGVLVLASATLTANDVSNTSALDVIGGSFVSFDVGSSSLEVRAGDKLAIVLRSDVLDRGYFWGADNLPGEYEGGERFVRNFSQSGLWEAGGDFNFRTFVIPDLNDGLLPDSDTGVPAFPDTSADRITADTTPSFFGFAEANSLVRIYADLDGDAQFDPNADLFLGETVAIPLDGTNQFPNGYWTFEITVDLNNPILFPTQDGLRTVFATGEDLAGNVSEAPDELQFFLDTQAPRVLDVFATIDPLYDLFDPKPSVDGPTPLIDSLTVRFMDAPERGNTPFTYPAAILALLETPGNYALVGDHTGTVLISSATVVNQVVAPGSIAAADVDLTFSEALPDDRFTLTVRDTIADAAGNRLDGESQAAAPFDENSVMVFPSGDRRPGGDFVARFTVDSRPEIGSYIPSSVTVDINGNFVYDPEGQDNDATNRDLTFTLPVTNNGQLTTDGFSVHDALFAGNFAPLRGSADGFDKLAAFGRLNGQFRFLIDTNNDGVVDTGQGDVYQLQNPNIVIDGLPFAGDFDGDPMNGDEVGLYNAGAWFLDTNRNFIIEPGEQLPGNNMLGYPIVGDFDGDGIDDLAVFNNDVFFFDLSGAADGTPGALDGTFDDSLTWGFSGVGERPVAADMNQDGIDDIGLWVPRDSSSLQESAAEWYFLVSDAQLAHPGTVDALNHPFKTEPFGDDLFAMFGQERALPILGNFDPPVTGPASTYRFSSSINGNVITAEAVSGTAVISEDLSDGGSASPRAAVEASFFAFDRRNVDLPGYGDDGARTLTKQISVDVARSTDFAMLREGRRRDSRLSRRLNGRGVDQALSDTLRIGERRLGRSARRSGEDDNLRSDNEASLYEVSLLRIQKTDGDDTREALAWLFEELGSEPTGSGDWHVEPSHADQDDEPRYEEQQYEAEAAAKHFSEER
jgi:hypothetical protein